MNKVSVIIPAYNNARFIDECLESVAAQTYSNIEILVINDGSTDNTLSKIQDWAKKDGRIRIFSQANRGVSYSRNFGIRNCSGQFLTFIDADDIVAIDFIETLVEMFESHKVDVVACGIKPFYNNIENIVSDDKSVIYHKPNLKQKLFGECGGFLANKMYRTDIIKKRQLQLNESIAMSEDLLFNLEYFNYCNSFEYQSKVKYFYRQYFNSAYQDLTNIRWFSVLDTYIMILNSSNLLYDLEKCEVIFCFCLILIEANWRVKNIKGLGEIQEKIKRLKKEYLCRKYLCEMKFKNRLKIFIFYFFPSIVIRYRRRKLGR